MKLIDYIKDTRGELKHVSWPTQRQATAFTILVILISLFTAFFLGFFDFIFTTLLDILISNDPGSGSLLPPPAGDHTGGMQSPIIDTPLDAPLSPESQLIPDTDIVPNNSLLP